MLKKTTIGRIDTGYFQTTLFLNEEERAGRLVVQARTIDAGESQRQVVFILKDVGHSEAHVDLAEVPEVLEACRELLAVGANPTALGGGFQVRYAIGSRLEVIASTLRTANDIAYGVTIDRTANEQFTHFLDRDDFEELVAAIGKANSLLTEMTAT